MNNHIDSRSRKFDAELSHDNKWFMLKVRQRGQEPQIVKIDKNDHDEIAVKLLEQIEEIKKSFFANPYVWGPKMSRVFLRDELAWNILAEHGFISLQQARELRAKLTGEEVISNDDSAMEDPFDALLTVEPARTAGEELLWSKFGTPRIANGRSRWTSNDNSFIYHAKQGKWELRRGTATRVWETDDEFVASVAPLFEQLAV